MPLKPRSAIKVHSAAPTCSPISSSIAATRSHCLSSQCSCPGMMVLTQRSGGCKLERVDSSQEGKGSCKRSNEHLHKNLSKKRYSSCDRAINRKPKSHGI